MRPIEKDRPRRVAFDLMLAAVNLGLALGVLVEYAAKYSVTCGPPAEPAPVRQADLKVQLPPINTRTFVPQVREVNLDASEQQL